MKLLLRRDQRLAILGGKPVFALDVRAQISDQDRANIKKYRLGATVLYEKSTIIDRGQGLLGLASRLAHSALNISVSVDDLANGKKIECKNIVEMLAIEGQIKEAAALFAAVLHAAATFGGEEIIDLAA